MSNSKVKLIILVVVLNTCIVLADNTNCPHEPEKVPTGRNCRKPCKTSKECKSQRKTCNCDGACGMTCFNKEANCTEKPEEIENGFVKYSSMVYESVAKYTCKSGFAMEGNEERICQSDRKWSGKPPKCTDEKVCGFPPRHSLGFPNTDKSAFKPKDVVTYECRFGYTLSGDPNITCGADFKWSARKFLCKKVSCGDPGSPLNGYIEPTDFLFGSWAVYKCDKGYEISSPRRSRLYCSTNGKWSGERPSCLIKTCPAPTPPLNGEADARVFEYGNIVKYRCNQGYALNGNDEGTCDENGEWGDIPKCEVDINCDFDKSGREFCGYTNEGDVQWNRQFHSNSRSGLPGYGIIFESQSSPLNNAILRSPVIPSGLTHCLMFYYYVEKQLGSNDDINIRLNGKRIAGIAQDSVTLPTKRWVGFQLSLAPSGGTKEILFEIIAKGSVRVKIDDVKVVKKECGSPCQLRNPCLNDGICVNEIENSFCSCTKYYTGHRCQKEVLCDKPSYFPHGSIKAPEKIPIDTVISYVCDSGYTTRERTSATCTRDGLTSGPPECTKIPVQSENCPKQYHELVHSCYRLYFTSNTYEEAKKVCEKDGGRLANIQSKRVNDFLWQNTKHSGTYNYWIGLHSVGFNTFWSDGSKFERGHGINVDLSDNDGNSCGKYLYKYWWGSTALWQIRFDNCNLKSRFICETWKEDVTSYVVENAGVYTAGIEGVYIPVPGLLTQDTKRQIYRQKNDQYIYLFYDYHPDTNTRNWYIGGYSISRGRPSRWKVRTRSNVIKPDEINTQWRNSRGGIVDITIKQYDMWEEWSKWECDVKCGIGKQTRSRKCKDGATKAMDCKGNNWEESICKLPSCSSSKDFEVRYNGVLYKFLINEDVTWSEANMRCINNGDTLAKVTNTELLEKLGRKMSEISATDGVYVNYWVNGVKDIINKQWRLHDNTVIPHHQRLWNHEEPNGEAMSKDCIELSTTGWNDHNCEEKRRFICEHDLGFDDKTIIVEPTMMLTTTRETSTGPSVCSPDPCNGGGICSVSRSGQPVCFCTLGNFGKFCEKKNACGLNRISGEVNFYRGEVKLDSAEAISEGNSVTLKCYDDQKFVIGETTITCKGKNTWSRSTKVVCSQKVSLCILEKLPAKLQVFYENGDKVLFAPVSVKSGSSMNFRCTSQEQPGSTTIKCINGEWESKIPTSCSTGNTCQQLPDIENGGMTIEPTNALAPYEPGTIAHFFCDKSYKLQGESEIKCSKNDGWSEKSPVCKEVGCILFTIDLDEHAYIRNHESEHEIEVESQDRLVVKCKNSKKKTNILCKGKLVWEPEYESITCP